MLPMKQEGHPAHNMKMPTENYEGHVLSAAECAAVSCATSE